MLTTFVNYMLKGRLNIKSILFSNQATLTINGLANAHNTYLWADENTKAIVKTNHQVSLKPIMWACVN